MPGAPEQTPATSWGSHDPLVRPARPPSGCPPTPPAGADDSTSSKPPTLDAAPRITGAKRLPEVRFSRRKLKLALGATAAVAAGSLRGLVSPSAASADCISQCDPDFRTCRTTSATQYYTSQGACLLPIPTDTSTESLARFLLGQVKKKAALPLTLQCLAQNAYEQEVRLDACYTTYGKCIGDCNHPKSVCPPTLLGHDPTPQNQLPCGGFPNGTLPSQACYVPGPQVCCQCPGGTTASTPSGRAVYFVTDLDPNEPGDNCASEAAFLCS